MEANSNFDISFKIQSEVKELFIKETLFLPCKNFHSSKPTKNQHIEFTGKLIDRFIEYGKVDEATFICGIILLKRFSNLHLPKTKHTCYDIASTILLIAHKWMVDQYYLNSTWKKFTYRDNELKKINTEELFILSSFKFKVAVFPDEIDAVFLNIYNKPQGIAEV